MKICKYEVYPHEAGRDDGMPLRLPIGSRILSVGEQNGLIFVWAEIGDLNSDYIETHIIHVQLTGIHSYSPENMGRFLGTVIMTDGLVFHFFVNGPEE